MTFKLCTTAQTINIIIWRCGPQCTKVHSLLSICSFAVYVCILSPCGYIWTEANTSQVKPIIFPCQSMCGMVTVKLKNHDSRRGGYYAATKTLDLHCWIKKAVFVLWLGVLAPFELLICTSYLTLPKQFTCPDSLHFATLCYGITDWRVLYEQGSFFIHVGKLVRKTKASVFDWILAQFFLPL